MTTPYPYSSIKARLLIPLLAILLAGTFALAVAAAPYSRKAVDSVYDLLLAGAVLQIGERVQVDDGEVVVDLPGSAFELLALAREDRVFYRILSPDGRTVTGDDVLPEPVRHLAPGKPVFYNSSVLGSPVRVAALRREMAERSLSGPVLVLVAQTMQARNDLAETLWRGALVAIALVCLLILLLSALAVRVALRPLASIDQALLAKNPRDLSPLVIEAPAELTHTVSAINQFLDRLRTQVNSTQSFIADVSHQLRTAITAIRAQAELAAEEDDPQRLRLLAARIHKRSVGLGRLSSQILNRAMVIHRADAVPLIPLDLRALALNADDFDHAPLPKDEVLVAGDPVSLEEALNNLISNALRYGQPPFAVRVWQDEQADRAFLAVRDHGSGIPPEHWEQAGERFNRIGQGGAESAGLGLAIVKAVAEAHQGSLLIQRGDDGGFDIGMSIPLLHEEPQP